MWGKEPIPGGTPKADALAHLPPGYSVQLADGRQIGSGGNATSAWGKAHDWALRNASQTSK